MAAGVNRQRKEKKMTNLVSDRTRSIVIETLPLMEQHRQAVEQALERYSVRLDSDDRSGERSKAAARAIADMLYGHARQLGDNGAPAGIVEMAQQHPALALGTARLSSFGDALKPIMRDALGAKATPPVLAAWGDAYWAIVRTLRRQEMRLAA